MAKTEKVFYILEQVRLCLDRKDFIRSGTPPVTFTQTSLPLWDVQLPHPSG